MTNTTTTLALCFRNLGAVIQCERRAAILTRWERFSHDRARTDVARRLAGAPRLSITEHATLVGALDRLAGESCALVRKIEIHDWRRAEADRA